MTVEPIATPCIGACKNVDEQCTGCFRTMTEILEWRHYSPEKRLRIMSQLPSRDTSESETTHQCPGCNDKAYCGMQAGEKHCWCFDVDVKDIDGKKGENRMLSCLCRKCLSKISS